MRIRYSASNRYSASGAYEIRVTAAIGPTTHRLALTAVQPEPIQHVQDLQPHKAQARLTRDDHIQLWKIQPNKRRLLPKSECQPHILPQYPARSSHRQESPLRLVMIPLDFLNLASRPASEHHAKNGRTGARGRAGSARTGVQTRPPRAAPLRPRQARSPPRGGTCSWMRGVPPEGDANTHRSCLTGRPAERHM